MRKSRLQLLTYILTIVFVLLSMQDVCYAESGLQLLTKTSTLTQDQEFRVVIAVTADTPNLACFGPIVVEFDSSRFSYTKSVLLNGDLEFEGSLNGNNQVILQGYSKTGGGVTVSGLTYLVGVYFNPIKTGSGDINIKSVEGFADQNLAPVVMPAGASIPFTVVAPVALSDNCNLAALNINPGTLTPAFSASQTNYAADVPMGTNELAVSATADDSKASVAVSGNKNLLDGANTILVIVTAEDGSKKTYTITVNRAGPTPTPPVTVSAGGGTLAIGEPPDGTPTPDGFYQSLTSVGGQLVPSFKALKGDLVLYYLVGKPEQSGFYYFDSASQAYTPFQVMVLPSRSFPVLIPGSSASLPAGFSETTLELNGQTFTAWRQDVPDPAWAGRDVVLLYLMDSRGNKGYFWLDKETLLLSPYSGGQTNVTLTPTPTPEVTPALSASPSPTQAAQGTKSPFDPWQLVSILLGFFCLILAALVIWLATRKVGAAAGTYHGSRRVDEPDGYASGNVGPTSPRPAKKPKIRRID